MGFSTTYIGHFSISPPLGPKEVEWWDAFSAWHGGPRGEPFRVPMNPRAEWSRAMRAAGGSIATAGSPDVPWDVYDWRPCPDGCCLTWHHREKSNDAVGAIRWLVDHLLGPRALARELAGDDLAGFTFDHTLDGAVAGVSGETDELFLVRAVDSRLTRETVVPGVDPYAALGWDADEDDLDDDDDDDDDDA